MVLVFSQNNKHYQSQSWIYMVKDSETQTRQTEFYSDEEGWVSPVPRADLVYFIIIVMITWPREKP